MNPWNLAFTLLSLVGTTHTALAQSLPAGGTTSWEIREPEEIVTFVLFDPSSPGVVLPAGLRFVAARDARMPEILAHLKDHPEHAEWGFSFVEITRHKSFLIDGRAPVLPGNGGIGLWFAPVDASGLAETIPKDAFDSVIAPSLGAVLALGIWIPDRDFVAHARERGFPAEFGTVTLAGDGSSGYRGEIRLDALSVRSTAMPRSDAQEDPTAGTQVLFSPGEKVEQAYVVAGSGARHRACDAEWSQEGKDGKEGNHPLSRGVFVGPTYLTTYSAPLRGSAYRLREPVPK